MAHILASLGVVCCGSVTDNVTDAMTDTVTDATPDTVIHARSVTVTCVMTDNMTDVTQGMSRRLDQRSHLARVL